MRKVPAQPDNTIQVPSEAVIHVNTSFQLTDDVKARLKASYPNARLKTFTFNGQTFVFRVLNRETWDTELKSWRKDLLSKKPKEPEEDDKQLIEVACVFPAMPHEFPTLGHKIVFWNNQPAGLEPRLARQIEHHSGFMVPDLVQEDEFYAEDLFEPSRSERPSEEVIAQLKTSCQLPMRLVGVLDNWYVIRSMKHSEGRQTQKAMDDDPEGGHDVKQLQRCILYGPTDFTNLPVGVFYILINNLRDISGLGEENVFNEVVEDL